MLLYPKMYWRGIRGDRLPLTLFRKRLTEGTFYQYSKFFYFVVSKICFQIYFYLNEVVLINVLFIANSSITCCLCFPPCAVAKCAVAHVSQTIRFEISSKRPPTLLFSNTPLIISVHELLVASQQFSRQSPIKRDLPPASIYNRKICSK